MISSGVAITQTGPAYTFQVADLAQNRGGVITITGVLSNPLAAGVFTNTAEAGVTVLESEMVVLGNNIEITSGDATPSPTGHTDFGSVALGEAFTHTFTINNSGEADLDLTGAPLVAISGPAASDFSVVAQPATPVGLNATTSFHVRFAPTVVDTRVAAVTIANNDSDENPYDFTVQGIGTIPTVQFTQAIYQVNEDGTAVGATVTLTRTGLIDGESQVQVNLTTPLSVAGQITPAHRLTSPSRPGPISTPT